MKLPQGLVVVVFVPLLWSQDTQVAKVLAIKNHDHGRIAYWEGRVPIYDGYPLYDITLLSAGKKYVLRYESQTGYYPSAWKAGSEVRIRQQGKGRFLLTNGSDEVLVTPVRGFAADCVMTSGPPVTLGPGPQVPCD
jgi:hypothetical protein